MNSSDETVQFKCEECGKLFEPDPEAMVELTMGGQCECCDGFTEKGESGESYTPEEIAAMNADQLEEIGLTPETREKLLAGEEVTVGAMCLCRCCQDRLGARPEGGASL